MSQPISRNRNISKLHIFRSRKGAQFKLTDQMWYAVHGHTCTAPLYAWVEDSLSARDLDSSASCKQIFRPPALSIIGLLCYAVVTNGGVLLPCLTDEAAQYNTDELATQTTASTLCVKLLACASCCGLSKLHPTKLGIQRERERELVTGN
jgi:hypothetical protein